jgi:glycine cleavage system H protein
VADFEVPDELLYSNEDEWVRDGGDRAEVGISDYAQAQLGDIVFVELPEVGSMVDKGDTFGVIESVKAVVDLYAPVSGKVIDVNQDLEDQPELVNEDCYHAGWLIAVDVVDPDDFDSLLDADAYRRHIDDRSE